MEQIEQSELKQVIQNNEQINQLIEGILKIRRERRKPIEINGVVDPQIEQLLLFEVKKCLEIYKLEFPENRCQGKDTVSFREQKMTADCYGGSLGLQITFGMQKFIDEVILPTMQRMGYRIDENGEPSFDETFKDNKEHVCNPDVKPFKKYVGSTKDQMDYFTLLFAKNGVDLDFIWDALAHEEMHTFVVNSGNVFLKEGTTEELTREICEKYNIHMSPHAHTQEANFVRKLELLVGRDEVIEAGMWMGKFKEISFSGLLSQNQELTYTELSEMFELLKSDPKKLSEKEIETLNKFYRANPNIAEQLKEIVEEYRKAEEQQLRYSKIAERFDSELGLKTGSFYKCIKILENMYSLSQNYKRDPKLYRDIYNLSLDELGNDYVVFQTKEGFKDKDFAILSDIRNLCNELTSMNPQLKINSFGDLITLIDAKIAGRELSTNDEAKDYSEVLDIQDREIMELQRILEEMLLEHDMQENEEKTSDSQENGKSGLADCMQDDSVRIGTEQMATQTVRTATLDKSENSKNDIGE